MTERRKARGIGEQVVLELDGEAAERVRQMSNIVGVPTSVDLVRYALARLWQEVKPRTRKGTRRE